MAGRNLHGFMFFYAKAQNLVTMKYTEGCQPQKLFPPKN